MAAPLGKPKVRESDVEGDFVKLASNRLEGTLQALLHKHEQRQAQLSGTRTSPSKSPIDETRDRFKERLIPVARAIGQRYRDKGIGIALDASDLLGGGRNIQIEITFGRHRTILEGTLMPKAIAFNETRFLHHRGGAVLGGPMLRGRRLSDEGFTEFLYDRIIALVRAANPISSA